jgi:hypothetical protein
MGAALVNRVSPNGGHTDDGRHTSKSLSKHFWKTLSTEDLSASGAAETSLGAFERVCF